MLDITSDLISCEPTRIEIGQDVAEMNIDGEHLTLVRYCSQCRLSIGSLLRIFSVFKAESHFRKHSKIDLTPLGVPKVFKQWDVSFHKHNICNDQIQIM